MEVKKLKNQNLLDFILTQYGSVEYINNFIRDNNINDISDLFNNKYKITKTESIVPRLFKQSDYNISTGI